MYTAMKYIIDTTGKTNDAVNYTCLKDSTVIVIVLGSCYLKSGNVKLNDTVLFEYSGSCEPKFMQSIDVKAGDIITFNLNGSNSGHRMYACILHEDGVF